MPDSETSTPAKPALRLVPLDTAQPELADVIADLHRCLLPTSPATLLGTQFLRDFYYTFLPAHGLLHATIAYVDEVPAGFIAVTPNPNGFMGAALRRGWHRLAWTLFISVIAQPFTRVPALWEAFRIMTSRTGEALAAGTGEVLSLGVLPAYTDPKFAASSGLRIGRALVSTAFAASRTPAQKKFLPSSMRTICARDPCTSQ